MTVVEQQTVAPATTEHKEVLGYYDNQSSFTFYTQVWGGEYLHVGCYPEDVLERDPTPQLIHQGGTDALEKLIASADMDIDSDCKLLDMGAAYGGAARYLAKKHGCRVVCVDLSAYETKRNREMTKEADMEDFLIIKECSFTETGEPDASIDVVFSQDSILHAGPDHRPNVFVEASRLLKKGGMFVFADIVEDDEVAEMASNDADKKSMIDAVYRRVSLKNLASRAEYIRLAEKNGFKCVKADISSEAIYRHYSLVNKVLNKRAPELKLPQDYVNHVEEGLQAWVAAASVGLIHHGFFAFEKL